MATDAPENTGTDRTHLPCPSCGDLHPVQSEAPIEWRCPSCRILLKQTDKRTGLVQFADRDSRTRHIDVPDRCRYCGHEKVTSWTQEDETWVRHRCQECRREWTDNTGRVAAFFDWGANYLRTRGWL
ncbi:hypothetical protein [Halalkalicoccus jeotgali]|uniref:Uncharacterized protein n=1 Tax=Halalkalicoccus jeotgali (strain DSM 18796 / CECT 7217 / JCM 14584 / KCTC 4019 / B3) TaxID=795797 RepID=D8J7F6_HALJB|nr:hypothetical protein [Halalkalicoccus jeotgali]ADJ14051.1 hypothetical protein HacjB3_03290 [Halalkalicoccus jeotgali B3]ELY33905.1 hypothetical protein C497_16017 [Halalkalicoccus jeotgali B3]